MAVIITSHTTVIHNMYPAAPTYILFSSLFYLRFPWFFINYIFAMIICYHLMHLDHFLILFIAMIDNIVPFIDHFVILFIALIDYSVPFIRSFS